MEHIQQERPYVLYSTDTHFMVLFYLFSSWKPNKLHLPKQTT
jgi:hypothetical protein